MAVTESVSCPSQAVENNQVPDTDLGNRRLRAGSQQVQTDQEIKFKVKAQ